MSKWSKSKDVSQNVGIRFCFVKWQTKQFIKSSCLRESKWRTLPKTWILDKEGWPIRLCHKVCWVEETLQTVGGRLEVLRTYRLPTRLPIPVIMSLLRAWILQKKEKKETKYGICWVKELLERRLKWNWGTHKTLCKSKPGEIRT